MSAKRSWQFIAADTSFIWGFKLFCLLWFFFSLSFYGKQTKGRHHIFTAEWTAVTFGWRPEALSRVSLTDHCVAGCSLMTLTWGWLKVMSLWVLSDFWPLPFNQLYSVFWYSSRLVKNNSVRPDYIIFWTYGFITPTMTSEHIRLVPVSQFVFIKNLNVITHSTTVLVAQLLFIQTDHRLVSHGL